MKPLDTMNKVAQSQPLNSILNSENSEVRLSSDPDETIAGGIERNTSKRKHAGRGPAFRSRNPSVPIQPLWGTNENVNQPSIPNEAVDGKTCSDPRIFKLASSTSNDAETIGLARVNDVVSLKMLKKEGASPEPKPRPSMEQCIHCGSLFLVAQHKQSPTRWAGPVREATFEDSSLHRRRHNTSNCSDPGPHDDKDADASLENTLQAAQSTALCSAPNGTNPINRAFTCITCPHYPVVCSNCIATSPSSSRETHDGQHHFIAGVIRDPNLLDELLDDHYTHQTLENSTNRAVLIQKERDDLCAGTSTEVQHSPKAGVPASLNSSFRTDQTNSAIHSGTYEPRILHYPVGKKSSMPSQALWVQSPRIPSTFDAPGCADHSSPSTALHPKTRTRSRGACSTQAFIQDKKLRPVALLQQQQQQQDTHSHIITDSHLSSRVASFDSSPNRRIRKHVSMPPMSPTRRALSPPRQLTHSPLLHRNVPISYQNPRQFENDSHRSRSKNSENRRPSSFSLSHDVSLFEQRLCNARLRWSLGDSIEIFIMTWNMESRIPGPEEFATILPPTEKYHLIFLGTQECGLYVGGNDERRAWENKLIGHLQPVNYVKVRARALMAIHGVLFAHICVAPFILHVESATEATGFLGGVIGNKGGVGIALVVGPPYQESVSSEQEFIRLLFVTSHFTPHEHNSARRNHDYQMICSRLRLGHRGRAPYLFSHGSRSNEADVRNKGLSAHEAPCLLKDFDAIFWCGDLNYRINGTCAAIQRMLNEHSPSTWLNVLSSNDQLTIEMRKGNVFHGFQEATRSFPPTYKFHRDVTAEASAPTADLYDQSRKRRNPSWTDRILFHIHNFAASDRNHNLSGRPPCKLQVRSYDWIPNVKTSDHRPVVGTFSFSKSTRRCGSGHSQVAQSYTPDPVRKTRQQEQEIACIIPGMVSTMHAESPTPRTVRTHQHTLSPTRHVLHDGLMRPRRLEPPTQNDSRPPPHTRKTSGSGWFTYSPAPTRSFHNSPHPREADVNTTGTTHHQQEVAEHHPKLRSGRVAMQSPFGFKKKIHPTPALNRQKTSQSEPGGTALTQDRHAQQNSCESSGFIEGKCCSSESDRNRKQWMTGGSSINRVEGVKPTFAALGSGVDTGSVTAGDDFVSSEDRALQESTVHRHVGSPMSRHDTVEGVCLNKGHKTTKEDTVQDRGIQAQRIEKTYMEPASRARELFSNARVSPSACKIEGSHQTRNHQMHEDHSTKLCVVS